MVTNGKLAVKAHEKISRSDKNDQNESETDDRDKYDADEDNDDRILDN